MQMRSHEAIRAMRYHDAVQQCNSHDAILLGNPHVASRAMQFPMQSVLDDETEFTQLHLFNNKVSPHDFAQLKASVQSK